MTSKVHTFKKGDVVATWFDTGAFGANLLFGVVIAAGPKAYRVRWESGMSNRIEQGRTICWLYTEWKTWEPAELKHVEERLKVSLQHLREASA